MAATAEITVRLDGEVKAAIDEAIGRSAETIGTILTPLVGNVRIGAVARWCADEADRYRGPFGTVDVDVNTAYARAVEHLAAAVQELERARMHVRLAEEMSP